MGQPAKTDGELLAEFVSSGREAPFEELVARHGRMVLGVCRRVLGEHHGAEDAAQAVFLTLAHKARSLRGHPSLAAWLHRVARHVALRARESRDLCRRREGEAGEMIRLRGAGAGAPERAAELLDGELDALPERYRQALLLHHVEGLGEEEAARLAGCRPGTLSARLSRGREMLRQRLERRGAALSGVALAGLLGSATGAALPAAFIQSTSKAAVLALAGQAAAAGAVAAEVAVLTKGALSAMFWAKVKIAAAVLAAAATVSTAVPVTVHVVRAAEEAKKPEAAASPTPAAEPAKEEVLEFRTLEVKDPHALEVRQAAWQVLRSRQETEAALLAGYKFRGAINENKGALEAIRAQWLGELLKGVDLDRKMILAAFKGPSSGHCDTIAVSRVSVRDGTVRVDLKFERGGCRVGGGSLPFALVACPRRDLPVVFFENGKEAARVPSAPAEDKEPAGFLKSVRHARAAGTVRLGEAAVSLVQEKGAAGLADYQLDLASLAMYYGRSSRETLRFFQEADRKGPAYAPGTKVIFLEDEFKRNEAVEWSPEREKAVRFALAPGWTDGKCPFCLLPKNESHHRGKCPHCARDIAGSGALPKRCRECAALLGRCWNCDRTVGPATRGVEIRLLAFDPRAKTELTPEQGEDCRLNRLRVGPGGQPRLFLEVKLANGVKEVSEIACANGKDLFWHTTLFFWLAAPGDGGQPVFAPMRAELASPTVSPLAASTLQVTPPDLFPKTAFAKPGTYTVRAAAGRLVSGPVTVVVEGEARPAPADPKALPPMPAPEPAPGPAAGGIQPRWQPGGEAVEAVDTASGKLLWKMNPGFAVGNVAVAGGQWAITAQDGRQTVTVDAATGKMLRRDDLAPPKPAVPREVF